MESYFLLHIHLMHTVSMLINQPDSFHIHIVFHVLFSFGILNALHVHLCVILANVRFISQSLSKKAEIPCEYFHNTVTATAGAEIFTR